MSLFDSMNRAAARPDCGGFLVRALLRGARVTRLASFVVAAGCLGALAPEVSAQELPGDETLLVHPNDFRGPVRVSLDAVRVRYSDGSISGGVLMQQAIRRLVPAEGTVVAESCGVQWKVGMRVVALTDNPSGMGCVVAGEDGVVMSAADTGELLVEWRGKLCGHDGNGNGLLPTMPNDGRARWFVDCDEIAPLRNPPATPVLLDFNGFIQGELPLSYYNGGTGSYGTGPGPASGATFLNESAVYNFYNGSNNPSPGILALIPGDNTMTINLANPIRGFSYFYTSSVNVTLRAYSGPNGTGTMVSTSSFGSNSNGPAGNQYNTWNQNTWTWTQDARSIVLTGTGNFWGLDNLSYINTPPCPGGDCNGNGVCDADELAGNDCNGNGVLDVCDIAAGTPDCNGNGRPDSCDIASGTADCNANGVPDSCELASGAAQDCNGNGIPDSCDIAAGSPDCNNNGRPDSCDLQNGSALDCNGNGIPDACDIASGAANDVNGNGIPDTCEPDCNGNGVPDAYEVAAGLTPDCNQNGLPDSCDIAGGAVDCDSDGVIDSCELGAGTASDCNGNGTLDNCDIASGTPDCNQNGIPDSCDLANGTPDCNANGIPDSCDLAGSSSEPVRIGFEEFQGATYTPITTQFPGLVFETGPNGSQWTANDVTVPPSNGQFNASGWDCETEQPLGYSTGSGNYWLCGRVWCYPQNPYSGSARIRLTGSGASYFQLRYCAGSTLYLTAYDADGVQIDVDSGAANRRYVEGNSSGPGTLRVEAPAGKRIASVTVNDSGNFWEIDSIVTDVGVTSSTDCNQNGIPDSCDLANGAPDCNTNGIPDSCDIASGTDPDPEGDGIPNSCEPASGIRLRGPSEVNSGNCPEIGSELVFDVFVDNPPVQLVAGQFGLSYDTSVLEFIDVTGGDEPFTYVPLANNNSAAGTLFFVASVQEGGTGTLSDSRVARIRFRAIANDCDGSSQVSFDETQAPVLIANGGGTSVDLPLTNPAPVRIVTGAPVLSGVPSGISVPADAGAGCQASRTLVPPTASSSCGSASVSWTRSDGQPLNAPWPCGTTTVTWSATDICGRVTTDTTAVTVSPYHLLDVSIAYDGSGYAASMTRCIDLGSGAFAGEVLVTFVHGVGTATVQVPVGTYSCATADDDLHSLGARSSVSIQGTNYAVVFAGTSALVNGDITDDNKIDVTDWGIAVVTIGATASVNTDCSTTGYHVDFDGNGIVNSVDGNFVLGRFLALGAAACGDGGFTDGGLESITVAELAEFVGSAAVAADLNGDAIVDQADIQLWLDQNGSN